MSSTYAVLCLSHDPAVIAADGGWQSPAGAEQAVRGGIEGHEQCDLLLGRYSASLIELGCPPSHGDRRQHQHRCNAHSHTQWVDLGWLRLLALAQEQPAGSALLRAAGDHVGSCWPVERLGRLRAELSLGEREESKAACPDPPGHETHSPPCGFTSRPPLARPAVPPCSINHDCPGQPRPEPLTARSEARCQSQHRAEGGALVQCARQVHPDGAHTDYDPEQMWQAWNGKVDRG